MKRVFSVALCSLAFLFAFSLRAEASTSDNIVGWAWSPAAGWISFNCTNDSSCGTSNYGVNKNVDGTLTGYAWSSTAGWIKFGGFGGGFPAGGAYSQDAQVVGTSTRGWFKAIGADGNTWDGWISLSGTSPAYGVTQPSLSFSGYAWGGPELGWIQFDPGTQNPGVCPSACDVRLSGDASLDVKNGGISLSGNGAVPYGTIPTFVWTITNLPSTTCAVSKTSGSGTAFTTVSGITTSGTTTGAALTTASYTYSIDCTNPVVSKQISFTVAAQPPGFSLGGSDTANIQFLGAGTTDSESRNIFVSAFGGFTDPVTVSISQTAPIITPSLPASTTMLFSLGGGTFSTNPSGVVISSPYSSGTTFKARVIRAAGAPAFGGPYTITIKGLAASASSTETMTISPTSFNPLFQER